MKRIHPVLFRLIILIWVASFLEGCSRDPNVRKQKYLESGERYFSKQQYAAAAIQFANALQVDPNFAAAHYELARTYLRQQNWARAYKEFERTIEFEPQNYSARLDLAKLLIAGKQFKQAKEQIDILAARQPNDPEVHVANASLQAAHQDLLPASEELKKAIALNPLAGEPYLDLGLLQLKTNQFDSAEANLLKAIELMPKLVGPRLTLAEYYRSQRRFAEAEQQLVQAIDTDRQDPEPRIALARVYLTEDKKAQAEEFLKKSKKEFPANSEGYRMLGDFYYAVGDFDRALTEYASLAQDRPSDVQVKHNYVQLLILKNRLAEARKLNDAVLKATPTNIDALIERGQIEVSEGHAELAVATLGNVVKSDPGNAIAYYNLGIAFDRIGKLTEAENAWQSAIHQRPELVEAQRALALAALRKGDMAELERRSSEIIRLQPASADGYGMRALSYIRRGQLSEAEVDVRQAIAIGPQNPIGYVQMGRLMLSRRDFRQAEQAFEQALELDKTPTDALSGLIDTYLAQNRVDRAVAAAKTQITKVPNNSAFYDLLGSVLFNHKRNSEDLKDSEESFNKAVELDAYNVDAWLKLIQVRAVRQSVNPAITTCMQAIEKNPREASFYVLLGELYNSKKQWDAAKEAFEKSLAITPQNPSAANDLAYLMLQTGDNPDLAMPLAEAARRGMPNSPQAADTMGWALYHKGAYASAITQFQEALKLAEKARSPENPTVHFHLGLAYQRIGQVTLAREHLQHVLKINPNYPEADDVKRVLSQLHS